MPASKTAEAASALACGGDWEEVLGDLLAQLDSKQLKQCDLAVFFASSSFAPAYPQILGRLRAATAGGVLIGCSGQGVIGGEQEIEGRPAMALLTLALPGTNLNSAHFTQSQLETHTTGEDWLKLAGVSQDQANSWLLFADPFSADAEGFLNRFSTAYPHTPLVGGLASADPQTHKTYLFLNDDVYEEGMIGLALSGSCAVRTIVSQGCMPIGQTWAITSVNGNAIETIAQRPALEVLLETLQALPSDIQERARRNLLVGFAMDEYKDDFGRGDFLIRNLFGMDRESGSIVVGALPHIGQTLQFQIRDPQAADEDLRELLGKAVREMTGERVLGAVLCSCNGRGVGLFGAPHHDAEAISELLGPLPLAGFFCNGEIGPVAGRNFLHGFTASMAVIVAGADDHA